MSFRISVTPSRRAAARFIGDVRRSLQKALIDEGKKSGLTQSEVARRIGVHRSVINRELRGAENLTLGRVAELAWAMGRKPALSLIEMALPSGSNNPPGSAEGGLESLEPVAQGGASANTAIVVGGPILRRPIAESVNG